MGSSQVSGYKELSKCTIHTAANSIISYANNTDGMYGKKQPMNYVTGNVIASLLVSSFMLTRNYALENEENEENKEENDKETFRQLNFE